MSLSLSRICIDDWRTGAAMRAGLKREGPNAPNRGRYFVVCDCRRPSPHVFSCSMSQTRRSLGCVLALSLVALSACGNNDGDDAHEDGGVVVDAQMDGAHAHDANVADDDLGVMADAAVVIDGALTPDSGGSVDSGAVADSGAVFDSSAPSSDVAQSAYVKATNTGEGDAFGYVVCMSGDGNTLAIGAPGEDSSARGIDGDQTSNAAVDSGAVYVFVRSGSTWVREAYLKASNGDAGDRFGASVAIGFNGSTLLIGAEGEDSNATGVNGDETNNGAADSGAAYIFKRSSARWRQAFYLKASNTRAGQGFGAQLASSTNADTMIVTAVGESSNAVGVDGAQTDTSAARSGAAYVFSVTMGMWFQEAYLKASNTRAGALFGSSVAVSDDGYTVAIGAVGESSNATGADGNQSNTSAANSGAVYVFNRAVFWTQQAYLKATNTEAGDRFGANVAVSGDGATVAVQARDEDGGSFGVGGDQSSNANADSGAVYTYTRVDATIRVPTHWVTQSYFKGANAAAGWGASLALSTSGQFLAVGSPNDNSDAVGVDGDVSNTRASRSGAAYWFTRTGGAWSRSAYVKASNTDAGDAFGTSVAISRDASMLVVGAPGEASRATGIGGDQSNDDFAGAGAAYVFSVAL